MYRKRGRQKVMGSFLRILAIDYSKPGKYNLTDFKAQRPSGKEYSDEDDLNMVKEAFCLDRWENLNGILARKDLRGSLETGW